MLRRLWMAAEALGALSVLAATKYPECTFENCPVCLPDAVNKTNDLDLYVDGSKISLPLRIGRCLEYWDTQALIAQFVGILAKEKLGINIEYIHAEDEVVFFLGVNNCRNWMDMECKKVVRNSAEAIAAKNASEKLYVDAAPDVMFVSELGIQDCCQESSFTESDIVWLAKETRIFGPVGFTSLNGFYAYPETVDLAWTQDKFSLGLWNAYTVKQGGKYFDTVQTLIDSGQIIHEVPCCDGTCPEATSAYKDGMRQLIAMGWKCVDAWWLSPACIKFGENWTRECIPVMDDGWGYFKKDHYRGMAESGLIVAKPTVGYDLFWELIYYKAFNVPFLWWNTDSQFTVLKPVRIPMPERVEKTGLKMMSTVGWKPVLEANEQLAYLLTNVQINNFEVDTLMDAVVAAQALDYWSGVDGGPALYQKLACDFLRNSRARWERDWLPDPRSCSLGKFYNSTAMICEPCPAGTYVVRNPLDGIPRCFSCPAGNSCPEQSPAPVACALGHFASSEGAGKCDPCAKGRYQNLTGQTGCRNCNHLMTTLPESFRVGPDDCACDFGAYLLGKDCVACPMNSTTRELDSLSPSSCRCGDDAYMSDDLKSCFSCPRGSETKGSGKTHISSCLCEKGTYLPLVGNACADCPEGFTCPLGSSAANFAKKEPSSKEMSFPMLKQGFWSSHTKPLDVYMCSASRTVRCAGGLPESCAGGHSGFLCTHCDADQLSIDTKCVDCTDLQKAGPYFVVIGIVGISICVYYLANGKQGAKASPKLLFSVFAGMIITNGQVIGTLNQLNVPWPSSVDGFFGAMSVLIFKPDTIAAECVLGYDPILRYAARFTVPFMVIVSFAILYFMSKVWGLIQGDASIGWSVNKTLNSIGFLFQVLFIALNGFVASPLQCYSHPNGLRSVSQYPSVICGENDQTTLVLMSMITLGLFVLPFIAISIWAAVRVVSVPLKNDAMCVRFRYLLYRFRPDVWWWGLVFTARQTALAFAPIIQPDDPNVQIVYVVTILAVYIALLCFFWPWKWHGLNVFDAFSAVVLMLLVVTVSSFMPASTWPTGYSNFLLILVLCLAVIGGVCLVGVVMVFLCAAYDPLVSNSRALDRLSKDLRRFSRFLIELPHSDFVDLLSEMNIYDRKTLQSGIVVLQSSVGDQYLIAEKLPPRLYHVQRKTSIKKAAERTSHIEFCRQPTIDSKLGLVKDNKTDSSREEEPPPPSPPPSQNGTEDSPEPSPESGSSGSNEKHTRHLLVKEMDNELQMHTDLPEAMRGVLPRHSPFFNATHDATTSATTCNTGVTTPRLPITPRTTPRIPTPRSPRTPRLNLSESGRSPRSP